MDEAARTASGGDPMQYAVTKLHLTQAHTLSTGTQVEVAVVDTAIDSSHPELKGSIEDTFDAVGRDIIPLRHGTEMASAIAAHGRLLGVAPGVRILAVRAFDGNDTIASSTTARVTEGLQWIAKSRARVVNMSFAGPPEPALQAVIGELWRKRMVLVAAAGNDGPHSRPEYPAAYPEVIAVTSTDVDDRVSSSANQGPYVSLAAPGVDVFAARPHQEYGFTRGTSVAAAQVSGVAALLLGRFPRLTPDAVKAILVSSGTKLAPNESDQGSPVSLVDAYQALITAPNTAGANATAVSNTPPARN
jgi:subtilisin family serine protease